MDPYAPITVLYMIMGMAVMSVLPITIILMIIRWHGNQGRKTVRAFRR